MEAILERTTEQEQRIAQSSIYEFYETSKKVVAEDSSSVEIKIDDKDEYLKIPKKALFLLVDILKNMAEGKSITLIPSDSEVGTQQAADVLNVSRPHLVKLLKKGEIPYKKVGTHRRIELKHLIAYENELKQIKKEKLDFLTRQAQELNLGY